jgi:hypothetical protein
VPAKPAANVAKLAPGFVASLSWPALAVALMGTLAWGALVRWRTGRHREAVWTSLVLPAGGVAACWLLLMTLGLPLLDYARSNRPWADRLAQHVPRSSCLWAPEASAVTVAALEHFGPWTVTARSQDPGVSCRYQLRVARGGARPQAIGTGWREHAVIRRPTARDETTLIFVRTGD